MALYPVYQTFLRRVVLILSLVAFPVAADRLLAAVTDTNASVSTTGSCGDSFSKAFSEKIIAHSSNPASVTGVDGWVFFPKELSHLAGDPTPFLAPNPGNPVPAIVDFKNQLSSAGIDLLVVPVPPKVVIYPEKLTPDCPVPPTLPPAYDSVDRAFCRELTAQGVHVLDLGDVFMKARGVSGQAPLYCRTDTHWSPSGIEIASREIINAVGNPPWMQGLKTPGWSTLTFSNSFTGDLAASPNDKASTETVVLKTLAKPGDLPEQLPSVSRQSPIVLLGDSHNLVFHSGGDMHAVGAGLPDLLAEGLGMPVDLVAVRGSGATAARWNLARRHDNLAGKKLVIWCFTARDFTEAGHWDKVPVIRGQGAGHPQPTP
jgi:SGNH hydrolase-like domain, acetyltransferase AlgX